MKVKSTKLKDRLIKIPFKGYPVTRFIPNMTTLLGLCVGLTAVYHALHQEWDKALWFIVLATVFDGMDGRLARFFNASSRFGAELDSLSDFVTFGVSPALVVYFYALQDMGRLGWGAVLIFCIAAGLRLARFNTALTDTVDDPQQELIQKPYFTGVPMPAAGLLSLAPLMISVDCDLQIPVVVYGVWVLIIAVLMVSKIRTFSFKGMKIQHNHVIFLLGFIGLIAVGLMVRPWLTLPIIGLLYMGSFVISHKKYISDIKKI